MSKERKDVRGAVAHKLLAANRHTCCMCRKEGRHVDIHHIDQNPANGEWSNLAVLCKLCHSRVTGDEGLGRRITPEEIMIYKREWELLCAGSSTKAKAAPLPGDRETIVLHADEHQTYEYDLDKGDSIHISFRSDIPIDFFATRRAYNRWLEGNLDMADCGDASVGVLSKQVTFQVDRNGWVIVVVCNSSTKPATVAIDLSVRPAGR